MAKEQTHHHRGYENVSVNDDSDSSSTEADEAVLAAPKPPRPTCLARFRSYRWLIDTFLLLVNVGMLVLVLTDDRREFSQAKWQVGGDFSGTGPMCMCWS